MGDKKHRRLFRSEKCRNFEKMNSFIVVEKLNFGLEVGRNKVSFEPTTDHALLEATRLGDEDAFAELVGRYRNQLTNYLFRITNDYEEAVDLAQETFVRVFCAADRYKTDYAFSTYLYRIATNLAISELRKRKRRKLFSLNTFFGANGDDEPVELEIIDEKPLPDKNLAEKELQLAVNKAIATLPEKYRAPVILRDIEGKSYEEIARILTTSEGTIKSRINRARNLLKDKLKNYI